MNHKGVEYTVVRSEPGFWHWRFRIGEQVKTGRTETNMELLAMRRAQLLIVERSRTPRKTRCRANRATSVELRI
jgi:hypothetical protein